jgi:hypothetical protein
MLSYLPKWLIVIAALLFGGYEIVTRLPDILLWEHLVTGRQGELDANKAQPGLITAQTGKTAAEMRQADSQAQLNALQGTVAQTVAQLNDTQAQLNNAQARLAQAQVGKTEADQNLANAQAFGQNLNNAGTVAGAAIAAGALYFGAKAIGLIPSDKAAKQTADQSSSQAAAEPTPSDAPTPSDPNAATQ